jgi:predicted hotdog family 3-hydroxylacyl-ACP dehydratase
MSTTAMLTTPSPVISGLEPVDTFPAIEDVLPHRGTMLLLNDIVSCTDDALAAHATVDPDAWYSDVKGAMPAWIGIELMAQAIAAHVGLIAMRAGGLARPGVLLGTNRYEAHESALAPGAPLRVEAKELLKSEQGYGAYECTITADGRCLAQAVVKVFQPTDFQAFIEGSFTS